MTRFHGAPRRKVIFSVEPERTAREITVQKKGRRPHADVESVDVTHEAITFRLAGGAPLMVFTVATVATAVPVSWPAQTLERRAHARPRLTDVAQRRSAANFVIRGGNDRGWHDAIAARSLSCVQVSVRLGE